MFQQFITTTQNYKNQLAISLIVLEVETLHIQSIAFRVAWFVHGDRNEFQQMLPLNRQSRSWPAQPD